MIYCTKDCIHQRDGNCMLEELPAGSTVSAETDCVYFQGRRAAELRKEPFDASCDAQNDHF